MIRILVLSTLAASLLLSSGCLFSRKSDKPKESSAIAREVEESFRQRWIDQRVAQLVTQGVAADAARTQAAGEFSERFSFTRAGRK